MSTPVPTAHEMAEAVVKWFQENGHPYYDELVEPIAQAILDASVRAYEKVTDANIELERRLREIRRVVRFERGRFASLVDLAAAVDDLAEWDPVTIAEPVVADDDEGDAEDSHVLGERRCRYVTPGYPRGPDWEDEGELSKCAKCARFYWHFREHYPGASPDDPEAVADYVARVSRGAWAREGVTLRRWSAYRVHCS